MTDTESRPLVRETEVPSDAEMEGPLRQNRDFVVVLGGQGVSAIGDAINYTALPLLVLFLTGSGLAMGIVGVLQTLPDLVLGLPVGALADRWDRRRMMLYADLGRAILTALIPLAFALGLPTMAVIILVTAPINALRVVWLAAYTAAVPNLVGKAHIGQASSMFEAIFALGFIVGPAVAGVLAATIGPAPTLAIDAATYLASVIALAFVRRPLRAVRSDAPGDLMAEIREGVAFLASHRLLRLAVLFWSTYCIALAGIAPAITYFTTIDLGLGEDQFGFTMAAYGLGSLLGALVVSRLKPVTLGWRMVGGTIGSGLGILGIATTSTPEHILVLSLITGVSEAFVLVSYVTLRASATPNELLGRVGGTARMITIGMQPIGFFLTGVLLEIASGRATVVAIGAFIVAGGVLFGLSSTLRRSRIVT